MKKFIILTIFLALSTSAIAQTYTVDRVIGNEMSISAEYRNKIVYTSTDLTNTSLLQEDCARRGGNFNACGSQCDASLGSSSGCSGACVFTCEFNELRKDSFDDSNTYTVERVIDCDTLKLSNGEKVRLIGIDCPESRPNDKLTRDAKRTGQDAGTILAMGKEATEFVKGLGIEGKKVRLEFDVQERDKYGRLLAYVWYDSQDAFKDRLSNLVGISNLDDSFISVPSSKYNMDFMHMASFGTYLQTVFLNASIVNAGYAVPLTIPPDVKYAKLFKEWYQEAREEGRGLWNYQKKLKK